MFRRVVTIAVVIAILSTNIAAQDRPSVVGASQFVSLEGRFSISLPDRQLIGGLTFSTPFGDAKGDMFQWQTKEGTFGVGYVDAVKPLDDPESLKQAFKSATDSFNKIAQANTASIAAVKQLTLDKYPGIEQRADLFTGAIIQRTYIASQRIYETVAVLKNEQRVYESIAVGVLNSFKLLNDAEVTARVKAEIAKAEPSPLPQTPMVQRTGTDASDHGLRGRVKTVLGEIQSFSADGAARIKRRVSFDTYNEQGNKLRSEWHDYRGNLDRIGVYGYIDGNRVSRLGKITHEYNPPPIYLGPAPGAAVKKPDPRYDQKLEYKYDEKKRLIEETHFKSNGDISARHVYKYTGNQKERLLYAGVEGSPYSRSVATVDDKGNDVEVTLFNQDGSVRFKETNAYEFDSQGNWIKRTESRIVTKDGREQRTPSSVFYRTITYY